MEELKNVAVKSVERAVEYHIKRKRFDIAMMKLKEAGTSFGDAPHTYWMLAGDIYAAAAGNDKNTCTEEHRNKCNVAHFAYDRAISMGASMRTNQAEMSALYAKKADLYLDMQDNENAYKFYEMAANTVTEPKYAGIRDGYLWSKDHIWSKPVEKVGFNEFNAMIMNGCGRKSSANAAHRTNMPHTNRIN